MSATAQWPLLLLCVFGALAGTSGVYWDLGWHYDRGRDTALSAPHLLIGLGSMVLALALVVWSILLHRRHAAGARVTLPLSSYKGITYSPLLLVAFVAANVPPVALAIDEVWHRLFGLDTSLWSPTHLLAILAGPVAMIAVSALLAWEMNQRDPGRARRELRPWAGAGRGEALAIATFATVAATLLLPWAEYDFDLPQWDLTLAGPLLVAILAFPTFLAIDAVGRRWTATLVLASVTALRLLIVGFVMAVDQTAPDIVIPVLAGLAVDVIVIAGGGVLRGRTLAAALVAFPVVVVGTEALRLFLIGQEKWLTGLFPYGWIATFAAAAAAGYLGTRAGRWLRPATAAPPHTRETVRSVRELRPRHVVGAVLTGSLLLLPAETGLAASTADSAANEKTMVPAEMEIAPAEPRAGEKVTIRVSRFKSAREVTPQIPTGESVRQTGQPAPFLEKPRREPQVIAYYGGTWLREPMRRRGAESFEATITFPHEGNWRLGPFFYVGDYRWTKRVPIEVADAGAPAGPNQPRKIPLELAAEADPVDAPTWLKPIGFALLGLLFVGAIWLVVVQLRIVRDGGITAGSPAPQ